jgi:hypothetical protein
LKDGDQRFVALGVTEHFELPELSGLTEAGSLGASVETQHRNYRRFLGHYGPRLEIVQVAIGAHTNFSQ